MRTQALLVLLSLILVFTTILQADIIHVPSQQPTIQAGIDAAVDGDTVLVANGTYTGDGNRDIDFLGKAIVVMSENGAESCIINCEGSVGNPHRGFYFHSGEDSTSVLRGFTIQYGRYQFGGGLSCEGSSPKIKGNVIRWNDSTFDGGGIYCNNSTAIIDANTILGNEAGRSGAGIAILEHSGRISRNLIRWNVTARQGGGIHFSNSMAPIQNNSILNNTAEYGGGIYFAFNFDYPAVLEGNLIKGNSSDMYGGGIYCREIWYLTIKGNTIVENTVDGFLGAGAAICSNSSSITITNCIIWANVPDALYGGGIYCTYSDVDQDLSGEGTINVDPLFRDPASTDYHLMSIECGFPQDSPCIDAGHPDSIDVILDCGHGLRAERCDMGAYGGRGGPPVSIKESNNPKVIPLPKTFSLSQNYPNPFNPTTTISFDIPGELGVNQHVSLSVYDLRGRFVKGLINSDREPGTHKVIWNGRNKQGQLVSSGIYLYTLKSEDQRHTRKMVVVE